MNPPDQETVFKVLCKSGFAVKTIIQNTDVSFDRVYHRFQNYKKGIESKTSLTEEERQKLWDAIPDKHALKK